LYRPRERVYGLACSILSRIEWSETFVCVQGDHQIFHHLQYPLTDRMV